jgi:nucleotide-binding universal stress UspA family protein
MRTLICIRQFPHSKDTLRLGSLVAEIEDATIILMTVVDDDTEIPQAEAGLVEARSFLDRPGAAIKVRKGNARTEILKESQENEYDLIVLGAHVVVGFLDTFLGTITGKVADKATTSVMVARDCKPELKRILVSVGGKKLNRKLIETGANLAEAAGAALTALHVTAPVPAMYTGLEGMEETLEEMLQTDTPIAQHLRWIAKYLADRGVESEIEIRHGAIADEIVREAIKGEHDLIVLGASAFEGPLQSLMTEKISPRVVDKAPCSVFVVKDNDVGSKYPEL